MLPNATSILEGKVQRLSLPSIEGRPGPDAPRLKRLLLAQGELAHFWDGEEPIHYLAYMELRGQAVRGNHYHLIKRELVYVISGEVLLAVEAIDSKQRDSIVLRTGDLGLIETRIAHAYKTVTPGHAIEFSKARFDAADVHAWNLI